MNKEKRKILNQYTTVTKLAHFVNVERPYLSLIITGKKQASDSLANRLAAACNMYTQRTCYFLKSDFMNVEDCTLDDTDIIDQRIATLEIEIAQRFMTIDDLRRTVDPSSGSILDGFATLNRLMTIMDGLRGDYK